MTDHLSWETLNDLVDGVLDVSAAEAASRHARGCVTCGGALDELRATVATARALPGTVPPPDELWGDIRSTIEAGKVAYLPPRTEAPRGWWITPGRLAAAAVVLVALTTTLTGIVMSTRTGPRNGTVSLTTVAWQSSERAFQASVVELREQLDGMQGQLAPETVAKVERALATIDLAIAEAREALLRDPANAALTELLASNYRQKIGLLRRMTQLAS